mgnify:CR=1 FL=1
MCGCNAVVAVLEELRNNVPPLLIRAYSYLYGIPIVMTAGKTAYFADISAVIELYRALNKSPLATVWKKSV